MDLAALRYPVGEFDAAMSFTGATRKAAIDRIAALPAELRAAVNGLNDSQLDTPYRPQGWTVRQVVHHLADSHMNGLTRTKLALTESNPTIKPYDENAWAALGDMRLPIDLSLGIIDGINDNLVPTGGRAFFGPRHEQLVFACLVEHSHRLVRRLVALG